jgi:hypothetical protein
VRKVTVRTDDPCSRCEGDGTVVFSCLTLGDEGQIEPSGDPFPCPTCNGSGQRKKAHDRPTRKDRQTPAAVGARGLYVLEELAEKLGPGSLRVAGELAALNDLLERLLP